MPVSLTVNGTTFQYPTSGDEPGWGEEASAWASEVTNVLGDLLGVDDILQTTVSINNNQSSAIDVEGLIFNSGTIRSSEINYTIYRVSTANPSGHAETGTMKAVYDNSASSGNKWQLSITDMVGVSGVNFSILDSGQIQYTSTDINSTGYSGTMIFRAKSLSN